MSGAHYFDDFPDDWNAVETKAKARTAQWSIAHREHDGEFTEAANEVLNEMVERRLKKDYTLRSRDKARKEAKRRGEPDPCPPQPFRAPSATVEPETWGNTKRELKKRLPYDIDYLITDRARSIASDVRACDEAGIAYKQSNVPAAREQLGLVAEAQEKRDEAAVKAWEEMRYDPSLELSIAVRGSAYQGTASRLCGEPTRTGFPCQNPVAAGNEESKCRYHVKKDKWTGHPGGH